MRAASKIVLICASGLLAGCNPRGGLYDQGPWGPANGQRSYPQYSAPWSSRSRDSIPAPPTGDLRLPQNEFSTNNRGPSLYPASYQRVASLPEDPQPSAPAAAPVGSDTHPTVEELPPKEAPLRASDAPSSAAVSPPGVFTAPRRASSYAGTWKATDDKGNSCVVHLSSVASLDLYKASVSKCSNGELRDVNLWKLEENRVALFSRGTEIARLEGAEASLSGTLRKSGTPLKLAR